MREQLALLPGFLNAHLELALPALAVALLVAVPLGIAVTRRRGLEPAVLGVASVIQTIPSLALLDDDRGVIPPYDAIVLASPRLAAEHPAVLAALAPLVGPIDAATMQRLNLAVDRDGRAPARVASDFLAALMTDD